VPHAPAELLFQNGEILTLNPAHPSVDALAVGGGKIIALGSRAEVAEHCATSTHHVDLAGRVLLPSLKDHHLHLQAVGFALLNRERNEALFLDLSAVRSERELAARVAARAATQPERSWIVGTGWNENFWEGTKLPTHHVLSEAVPDHPAFLVRVDSHSALVNSAALRLAGIGGNTPDPYGGEIRRMSDGMPSGMLIERAVEPVLDRIPLPPDDVVRAATQMAAHSLAARGYTEIMDAGTMHFPGLVAMNAPMRRWLDILRDVDRSDALPVNVNIMVPAPSEVAEQLLSGKLQRELSPRIRFTHVKLYADGAFGSRGALMHEPYSDDAENLGVSRMTEEEMFEYAMRAIGAGLDVAIHAIGDAAVGRVLNVHEKVLRSNASISPRRLRLEHFSVATSADIQRAARLGILIVAQPGFVWPMSNGFCMEDYRLGDERVRRAYAWRTLLNLGAQIAGSSDDYSLPPHALWNFHAAATRKNPEGVPRDGWQGQECLTREESLLLFTRLAAPGGGWRDGQLRQGGTADLMVLSADPLHVPESQILEILVIATLRNGRVVSGAL
jgi:hypothetical protein